jgi:geranylgeranylglycerol-phosphate geranylgeranyltransferase
MPGIHKILPGTVPEQKMVPADGMRFLFGIPRMIPLKMRKTGSAREEMDRYPCTQSSGTVLHGTNPNTGSSQRIFMVSGIGIKARACAELIRPDLAFGAGFFVVAGMILAGSGLPPPGTILAGFLALFFIFIAGSANVSNDYFDREVDRVNLPGRPLPSGRITVRELWVLFVVCSAAGLAAAACLGLPVLVLAVFFWALSLLYNMKLKEYGIAGNLVVATCVGMTIVFGGITAGTINGVVLTFAALAFFFDLGEEIASDAMDVRGDQVRSPESLAKRWGRDRALAATGLMYGIFFVLTLLPFLAGWLGYDYLLPVALMDLYMIACSLALVRSRVIAEGRVQIRRLYLAWGIFVIVFVIIRVL